MSQEYVGIFEQAGMWILDPIFYNYNEALLIAISLCNGRLVVHSKCSSFMEQARIDTWKVNYTSDIYFQDDVHRLHLKFVNIGRTIKAPELV